MGAKYLFILKEIDNTDDLTGTFYVIENFPYPQFVFDEEGNPKSFDTYETAAEEANDCQEGYVICL